MGANSSHEEMCELANLIISNDLWVLSDEAYFDIVYGIDFFVNPKI